MNAEQQRMWALSMITAMLFAVHSLVFVSLGIIMEEMQIELYTTIIGTAILVFVASIVFWAIAMITNHKKPKILYKRLWRDEVDA